jgi:hypothetical protein
MKTIVKTITAVSLAALAASAFAAQQLSFGQLDGITAGELGLTLSSASQTSTANNAPAEATQSDPVVNTNATAGATTGFSPGLVGVSVDAGGGSSAGFGGSTFGGHAVSNAGQISYGSASGTHAAAGGGGSGAELGFANIDSSANASPWHTGGHASADVGVVSFWGPASANAHASTTSAAINF